MITPALLALIGRTSSGAAPPPVVLSVSPEVADTYAQTITVSGGAFVSGAVVELWQLGALVLSLATTFVNATTLTAITGSVAAGVYDVVVRNPDTQTGSLASGIEVWHPLSSTAGVYLAPGAYDPEGAGPGECRWTDSSGNARHATRGYNNPPAVDGCPSFSAAAMNPILIYGASLADEDQYPGAAICTRRAGTIVTIDVPTEFEADASFYYNGAIVCGQGATPGVGPVSAPNFYRAWGYDDVDYRSAYSDAPATTGVASIVFTRWDDTTLSVKANDAATGSFALSPGGGTAIELGLSYGNIGPDTWIGASYAAAYLYDGVVRLVAGYPATHTDSWCERFRKWAQGRGHV